jgi:MerR family transcriptional regulator, light-induced transcriptional regulator
MPNSPIIDDYLGAALTGRRREALDVALGALSSGWSITNIYTDLLIPAQRALGVRWASGQISVAQEHLASAVTGSVLARIYEHIPASEPRRGRVLVAAIEGELHGLPAHFAADLLELQGWDVTLVGPNVPQAMLLSMVEEQKPDLVGLSVTMAFNLPPTIAVVRALLARSPGLRIALGGRAMRGQTALASELDVELEMIPGQV